MARQGRAVAGARGQPMFDERGELRVRVLEMNEVCSLPL